MEKINESKNEKDEIVSRMESIIGVLGTINVSGMQNCLNLGGSINLLMQLENLIKQCDISVNNTAIVSEK